MKPPKFTDDILASIERTIIVKTGDGEFAAYVVEYLRHAARYARCYDGE